MSKIKNLVVTITIIITTISVVSANQTYTNVFIADEADVHGKWDMSADLNGQSISAVIDLKQDKDTFTGTLTTDMGSGVISNGKINGNDITANVSVDAQGQQIEFILTGKVDKKSMTGSMDAEGGFSVTFTAKKIKEKESSK